MADSNSQELTDNQKLEEMCNFFEIDPRLVSPIRLLVSITYKMFTSLRNAHLL